MCSKGFYGCSGPERAGVICRRNSQVAQRVGDDFANGKKRTCGWICGARSSPSSTIEASSIGARPSWTGASLLQKRGRVRRQDQARQGNKVDGGGRRQGCSSGKPTCLGIARGGQARGVDARRDRDRRPRKTTDPRSRIRQRQSACSLLGAWNRDDLSASTRANAHEAARWSTTPPIPQALDHGARVRLARQLPQTRRPLRPRHRVVQGLLSRRLRLYHVARLMKPLLVTADRRVVLEHVQDESLLDRLLHRVVSRLFLP